MSLKDFKKRKSLLNTIKNLSKLTKNSSFKRNNQERILCKACGKFIYLDDLKNNLFICPHCSSYLPLTGEDRFDFLLDKGYRLIDFGTKN